MPKHSLKTPPNKPPDKEMSDTTLIRLRPSTNPKFAKFAAIIQLIDMQMQEEEDKEIQKILEKQKEIFNEILNQKKIDKKSNFKIAKPTNF